MSILKKLVAPILLAIALACPSAQPASAATSQTCSTAVTWGNANRDCQWGYAAYQTASSDGAVWTVKYRCDNGGICASHVICTEGEEQGILYDLFRDGVQVGYVCVPNKERAKVDPGQAAAKAFKDFAWPASTLIIQPPGGRTLVNFDTIFYTTNTEPTTKQVKLLGQDVAIRATPSSYIFHFGDGESLETASEGHPYPNQDVFHQYTDLDPVKPKVDTVYTGEYKIGKGEWQQIDPTLTIEGATEDLEILEAVPQLVDDPNT